MRSVALAARLVGRLERGGEGQPELGRLRVQSVAVGQHGLGRGHRHLRRVELPLAHRLADDDARQPARSRRHQGVIALAGGRPGCELRSLDAGDGPRLDEPGRLGRPADILDEVEEAAPVRHGRCRRLGRPGSDVRDGPRRGRREDVMHLRLADVVDDRPDDGPRRVVAVRLRCPRRRVDAGRRRPVVEAEGRLVVAGDGVGPGDRPALGRDHARRVFVGQALADPALGEESAVEPGVRRLVDDDLLVEVLADLDLVCRRVVQPGVALDLRRRHLADPELAVDRPRQPDGRLEVGHAGLDDARHAVEPLAILRPGVDDDVLAAEVERDVGQRVVIGDVDGRVPGLRVGDVIGRVGQPAILRRGRQLVARVGRQGADIAAELGRQDDPDVGEPRVAPGPDRERGVRPTDADGAGRARLAARQVERDVRRLGLVVEQPGRPDDDVAEPVVRLGRHRQAPIARRRLDRPRLRLHAEGQAVVVDRNASPCSA